MDGWKCGCMDGKMNEECVETNKTMGRWMDKEVEVLVNGCKNKWTDEWTDE